MELLPIASRAAARKSAGAEAADAPALLLLLPLLAEGPEVVLLSVLLPLLLSWLLLAECTLLSLNLLRCCCCSGPMHVGVVYMRCFNCSCEYHELCCCCVLNVCCCCSCCCLLNV